MEDKLQNFHYAITLAQMLYDVEGDQEDLEEIGLIAYNFIGNKNTFLQKVILDVDCKTGEVQLPCGVDVIEAATYCGSEDWEYTSNIHENGNRYSRYVENYIEHDKAFLNPFYISGKYVKYRRVGDKLYVNKGAGKIVLLYHGVLLDEDGLPQITDKEAVAIADYIGYVIKWKEALRSNNKTLFEIATTIKQQWLVHCDAARVPAFISQNTMNEILDTQTSWGRKVYGRSYKPIM